MTVLSIYGFAWAACVAGPPDAARLQQAALQARRAITSAHLVVSRELVHAADAHGGESRHRGRYEFWLDREKLRVDVTPNGAAGGAGPGERITICRNCLRSGATTGYRYLKTAVVTDPSGGPSRALGAFAELFDPRLLGYGLLTTANMASQAAKLDTYIGAPTSTPVGAEEVEYQGRRVWLVRADLVQTGVGLKFWISPDQGHSPVRIESAGPTPARQPFTNVLEAEVARDPVSEAWFLRRSTLTRTVAGKVVTTETVDIIQSEVNRGVDPKVFTLAGMNVPVGTPVVDGDAREYWDGSRAVKTSPVQPPDRPTVPPPPEPVEPPPATGVRWWAAAAAVLFAVAAAAFLRRAVFHRR